MDKFCVFCGKPLAEGEACDCGGDVERKNAAEEDVTKQEPSVQVNVGAAYDGRLPEQTEVQPQPLEQPTETASRGELQIRPQAYMIPKREKSVPANYVKRCRVIFTRFFAHPVQIIRIAAEKEDATAGLFFWILYAAVSGLIPAFGIPRVMKQIVGAQLMRYIDYPMGLMWVQGFLVALGSAALLTVAAFVCAKAMHSRATFRSVAASVGVSAVGMTALTVIAWILMLIAPGFGLCMYLLGGGFSLVLFYLAFARAFGIGQNKTLYCLLIALTVVGLVMTLAIGGIATEIAESLTGNLFGGLLR